MAMDMKNRIQWADALESGQYRQGFSALTRRTEAGDEDCCLGVLCKIWGLSPTFETVTDSFFLSKFRSLPPTLGTYAGEKAVLPDALWKALHLKSGNPRFMSARLFLKTNAHSATYLNDTYQLTFSKIAALLRNPEVSVE